MLIHLACVLHLFPEIELGTAFRARDQFELRFDTTLDKLMNQIVISGKLFLLKNTLTKGGHPFIDCAIE